jgi:hypothetical protein
MQHIRNILLGLAFALSLLGCLVDDEAQMAGAMDYDDEPEIWDYSEAPLTFVDSGVDASAVNTAEADDDADLESASVEMTQATGTTRPEPADDGTRSATTSCGGVSAWKSPASGSSHAGIQNCSITWSKNILENPVIYWQTVSFQLRDEATDGLCARATVTGMSGYHSECNGVWVTKTTSLSGRRSSITITLSWGGNQPVSKTQNAPSGF